LATKKKKVIDAPVAVEAVAPTTIKAYKAFDPDWKCHGYQFKVGETYTHDGAISLCNSGFHACEAPLDVWNYYPIDAPLAEVELSGATDEKCDDTKRVARSITIKAALTIPMLISAQIEWTFSKAKEAYKAVSDYSTAASSGNSSKAASSGDYSKAASSGYSSKAASSGNSSKAASSGDFSKAEAKGENTIAMVAGCNGRARAGLKGAFALAWYDEANKQMRIAVGIVGENGIKPDVFYRCDESGKLIEVQD
jgi:hypothetical protein